MDKAIRAVRESDMVGLYSIDLESFINSSTNDGSLLYMACDKGDIDIVRLLLSIKCIDINVTVSFIGGSCVYQDIGIISNRTESKY
jgi:hypothetical protein